MPATANVSATSSITRLKIVALLGALCTQVAIAQSSIQSSQTNTSGSSATLNGQVVNAVTGSPIFRALVQAGGRAQLTDHEGRFSIAIPDQGANQIQVNKPGFYGSTGGEPVVTLTLTDTQTQPVVRLYPEALLTGTITSSTGATLSQIPVVLERSLYTESGHQWVPVGMRQTDSHGEFRLVGPAGQYRIQTRGGRGPDLSNSYIPSIYPDQTSSDGQRSVAIAPGAESHVEIRLESGQAYTVPVRLEPVDGNGSASITAITSTGASLPVNLAPAPTGSPARFQLPRGSYLVRATRNREDQLEFAEAQLRVEGDTQSPLVLHFAPAPTVPVTLRVDSGVTSDNAPTISQLGLMLNSSSGVDTGRGQSTLRPIVGRDGTASFRVFPGSYRLVSLARSGWYILSASSGGVDLLREDLQIAPGGGSAPIVLTISNQTGSLSGSVSSSGSPQAAWVYLVPTDASATPYLSVRSSPSGAYQFTSLPQGSYRAVAFEQRLQVDMRSPQALAPYSTYVQNVTVGVGEKKLLDLRMVSAAEMQP